MADNNNTTSEFNANETKIIMCLIKHLKGDLPTDFEAVAAELGYKDATIAKVRWNQIRRKKITGTTSDSPAKATPKKRKSAAANGADADDNEAAPPKPKKGRQNKKAKEEDDEEIGEEIVVKTENDVADGDEETLK